MLPFRCPGMGLGLFALASLISAPLQALDDKSEASKPTKSPLEFKVKTIDGQDFDLRDYLGRVVMVVNVASR